MLHHVSFNARSPEKVAKSLAGLLSATAIRSPSPPFPSGSWFVCYGDAAGSFLEIFPWNVVVEPTARGGIGHDEAMRPRSGSHVLASTPLTADAALALAGEEGWRTEIVDAGLFRAIKMWVEDSFLVELLPEEWSASYVGTFNGDGVKVLDGKLRDLEAMLSAMT